MTDDILGKLRERNRPTIEYFVDLDDEETTRSRNVDLIRLENEKNRLENKKLLNAKDDANNRRLAKVKKEHTALIKKINDSRVTLVFQAVEPAVYEALEEKYERFKDLGDEAKESKLKENERQKLVRERDKLFNTELLAHSSLEPKMDVEYVNEKLFPLLSRGEQMDILTKVFELNLRMPSANTPKELREILAIASK